MAKHAGVYRSEKRKKELSRQKKQEEKRQRRLSKKSGLKQDQSDEAIQPEEKAEEQAVG